MDENTNKKIEELKKNPPNRVLPILLIPVAMIGLFCYRVATTDPQWDAAESQSTAASAKSATSSAKPAATPPTAEGATAVKIDHPSSTASSAPTSAAMAKGQRDATSSAASANQPSDQPGPADVDDQPAKSTDGQQEQPAAENDTKADGKGNSRGNAYRPSDSALDDYLDSHKGQRVPFIYKGEKRTVVIVTHDDTTVTIKRKKWYRMPRSELSPAQLELWK